MITAAHVRADVIDVRSNSVSLPDDLLVDANVLYWVFYPHFSSLNNAGGNIPNPYQTQAYPSVWKRAANDGCSFLTTSNALFEFAKLVEFAELETHWLLDPDIQKPLAKSGHFPMKPCRYHYSTQLAVIRQDVEKWISGLLGAVALLHQFPTSNLEYSASLAAWLPSVGDFPDASLVAAGVQQGFTNILSDDGDLATFSGISLYTANSKALSVAQSANRLLP